MNFRLISFIILIVFSPSLANKYTKEANDQPPVDSGIQEDRNFRTQKLNFIWSKAVRKLSSLEQNELFIHLKKLDKQFLAAKYERDGGSDASGILAKELEKHLEILLTKYGLLDVYQSLAAGGGEKKDDSTTDDRNEARVGAASKSGSFKDEKLRRLWLDAVSEAGFNTDELAALEEELRHHQRKLDEYGKLSSNSAKRTTSDEKENSVLDEDDLDLEKTKSKHVNAELKQRFKDIQKDYDTLKVKVSEKVQSAKMMKSTESITHPRVVPLLEKARTVYSGSELESIEEELRHFQARLWKLEYLEREASHANGDHDPAAKAKKEKTAKIYDRELNNQLSDYSRKVEKYERYLSSKLEL